MPDRKHRLLTTDNGIHYIQAWEVADELARDGLDVTDEDAGKVCRIYEGGGYWVLADVVENEGGGFEGTWARLDNVAATALSDALPLIVDAYTESTDENGTTYTGQADAGTLDAAARADHKHAIATGTPVAIGFANDEGDSEELARSDHVHDGSALLDVGIVEYSGAALTLALAHVRAYLRTTSASAHTVTVPLAFADMPIGASISGIQAGVGRTQFVAAGGVTLNCAAQLYTRTRYSGWTLTKVATNTYDLVGDLLI